MKKTILTIIIGGSLWITACNAPESSTEASDSQQVVEVEGEVSYRVNTQKSRVKWEGSKLSGAKHFGTVDINSGELELSGNSVVSGHFVLDMTSLALPEEDIETDDSLRLLKHLRNADFFNVDSFPQAQFDITVATTDSLTGNLTIKGISKSIVIPYAMEQNSGLVTIRSNFSIDRTAWDIRYKSNSFFDDLGNKAIRNAIAFDVTVVASEVN